MRGGCLSVYTLPHFLVHTHYVDEQKKAVRCRDANTSRANREDNGIITDAGCLCTHYQLYDRSIGGGLAAAVDLRGK